MGGLADDLLILLEGAARLARVNYKCAEDIPCRRTFEARQLICYGDAPVFITQNLPRFHDAETLVDGCPKVTTTKEPA